MRTTAAIAASAVALIAAGALLPSQASAAKVKFGAELNESVQPSNALPGMPCIFWDPGASCSFVQNEAYGRPGGEKAPRKGTLKKVRVIAGTPGTFTLQLVKTKYIGGLQHSVVKAVGPFVQHSGQTDQNWNLGIYKVESFPVNVPIKKGWRLAMVTKGTTAVRCSDAGSRTLVHHPSLGQGWGYQPVSGTDGCYQLIEGVIKY